VCEVDIGQPQPLQIVCGAPNAAAGIKVPCAARWRCTARRIEHQGDHDAWRRVPGNALLGAGTRSVRRSFGLMLLPDDVQVGCDVRDVLELDDHILTIS